jgi:hypothetical protein
MIAFGADDQMVILFASSNGQWEGRRSAVASITDRRCIEVDYHHRIDTLVGRRIEVSDICYERIYKVMILARYIPDTLTV